MDDVYRRQRHFYDLTRKYYLIGRDHMLAGLEVPAGGNVLELGCGTGRNIILAARRYPDARFFGLDISHEMLTTAAKAISRYGLSDRVTLSQGDATAFGAEALFGEQSFNRVFISYALSMIPRLAKGSGGGICRPQARRLAPHRRLRPAGTSAALVPRHAARMARKIPCRTA